MSPEVAVAERILELGISALASRVYQLRLPQAPTLPAVRVQAISEVDDPHLRGGVGLCRTRVQVDVFDTESSGADPYERAQEIDEAIHGGGDGSGLSGWQGDTGGSPALSIAAVFCVDRSTDYEAGVLRMVRVRRDYQVFWKRIA